MTFNAATNKKSLSVAITGRIVRPKLTITSLRQSINGPDLSALVKNYKVEYDELSVSIEGMNNGDSAVM